MENLTPQYPRGSEWRLWDLHVHSPASFHWNGEHFGSDVAANTALVDQMINAFNSSPASVFALMDYWTFKGWELLRQRLQDEKAPALFKKVFPGIELRLVAPTSCRLNAHVLFSDDVEMQTLVDFRSALIVAHVNQPLSETCLINLARQVGVDKLTRHGFKKAEVDADSSTALRAGSQMAEITPESYKRAIKGVPINKALGFMPFDTSDGLSEVKWQDHYAYFLDLFESSPIFESRNATLRSAFVGERTTDNEAWFDNFQHGLRGVSRLVVSGSDAHRFGDYGKYPSGKATWIKADPTFMGLLQAVREPAKRSWIGERPDKLRELEQNKTYFINSIGVIKTQNTEDGEQWLHGQVVQLNPDLIAIIGNKGSGKSALADIIALLGNSHQTAHFSFLKKDRFRGKSGEPAKHFLGKITWCDGTSDERRLSEDPPKERVPLVRYIPQGHFENLCNDHVSGNSGAFERELRAVIFDHADDALRLGALDFDQLIDQQESMLRDQLGEFRKDLHRLNLEIETIEAEQQVDVRLSLIEHQQLKQKQVEEHNASKPQAMPKPSDTLTPEQEKASIRLDEIQLEIEQLDSREREITTLDSELAGKAKAILSIKERLKLLQKQFKQFEDDSVKDAKLLGLTVGELASLSIKSSVLDSVGLSLPNERNKCATDRLDITNKRASFVAEQKDLREDLNAAQVSYQNNLRDLAAWADKLASLVGAPDTPETLRGIEARIAQLDELPDRLAKAVEKRRTVAAELFRVLDKQRLAREQLFKPVQDLIGKNKLIREDYKLQFRATLGGSVDALASQLFGLVKQTSGNLRGEDESLAAVRKLYDSYDLTAEDATLDFAEALDRILHNAATSADDKSTGISSVMRKDRRPNAVYDLIYGLSYLEPRYTLLFQETPIEQLSPGQRGALLLIFYLLVDKGKNPIILDQPEENLDNQTVVSLLVPVLSEAKKRRQIIMVTHNPNLAVVCDAEQVIYSCFNRKDGFKIEYSGGSIEDPVINQSVVDILEGTKRAFVNRQEKYH